MGAQLMTELLLISVVGALGVAMAVAVGRWLATRPPGDEEIERVAALVNHGVRRYLGRQSGVAAALAAVLGASVLLAFGLAYQTEVVTAVSPRAYGVWVTLSYALGAGAGLLASWVAAWAGRQAIARVASGAWRSLDEPLQLAMRAGAVSGVAAVALALLGLGALYLGYFLYLGELGAMPEQALAGAPRIPLLLPGFALGAAFVALLCHLGGGVFGDVADIGADVAGKLGASLPEDAARNPAVVADLVGDNVGDCATRACAVFAAAVTECLGSMLVAALVYQDNRGLPSATAIVLFPLVARAFGLLSAWFGVVVVRTDDSEVPMSALSRGLLVTVSLQTVAVVGCAKWLLGVHWAPFAVCALLGTLGCLGFLYTAQYFSEPRHRPVRAVAEAARAGPTLVVLRGLLTGAAGSLVQIVLLVAMAAGAFYAGETTELEGDGLLGLVVALTAMLGNAPYVLAMDTMASVVDTAAGLVALAVGDDRPDVRARTRALDAVGNTSKGFTKSLIAASSSLGCFLLLVAFLREVWTAENVEPSFETTSAPLYIGALLGVCVVLLFFVALLSRIVHGGRSLVYELRGQLDAMFGADRALLAGQGAAGALPAAAPRSLLGELPPPGGLSRSPGLPARWGTPEDPGGQLVCVEIVSRLALRGMVPLVLVGVGVPLLVGVALRIWATGDRVSTSAEALVALLFVATNAGALGSLLFTNAGSAWDNAKKYIETGAHGGRYLPLQGGPPQRTSEARDGSGGRARERVDDAAGLPEAAAGLPDPAAPLREGAGGAGTSLDGAGGFLGGGSPGGADNPTYVAAVIADTIGDPLKGAVGPAMQALVTTLATLALVFLPFFL